MSFTFAAIAALLLCKSILDSVVLVFATSAVAENEWSGLVCFYYYYLNFTVQRTNTIDRAKREVKRARK